MSTPTEDPVATQTVDVIVQEPASILILEAMLDVIGDDGDLVKEFGLTGSKAEVQMFVNGKPADVVKSLAAAWKRLEGQFEDRAKERAIELCTGAGLRPLLDTLEFAEWQIRDKLEAVCPKNR